MANVTSQLLFYSYSPKTLILSYALGLLPTLIFVIIGLLSTYSNGISHSNSFSSFIATTRNPELDSIFGGGQCLGAVPLDKEVARTRLRFGALVGDRKDVEDLDGNAERDGMMKMREGIEDEEEKARHTAFGLEKNVESLRKGGKYV